MNKFQTINCDENKKLDKIFESVYFVQCWFVKNNYKRIKIHFEKFT